MVGNGGEAVVECLDSHLRPVVDSLESAARAQEVLLCEISNKRALLKQVEVDVEPLKDRMERVPEYLERAIKIRERMDAVLLKSDLLEKKAQGLVLEKNRRIEAERERQLYEKEMDERLRQQTSKPKETVVVAGKKDRRRKSKPKVAELE